MNIPRDNLTPHSLHHRKPKSPQPPISLPIATHTPARRGSVATASSTVVLGSALRSPASRFAYFPTNGFLFNVTAFSSTYSVDFECCAIHSGQNVMTIRTLWVRMETRIISLFVAISRLCSWLYRFISFNYINRIFLQHSICVVLFYDFEQCTWLMHFGFNCSRTMIHKSFLMHFIVVFVFLVA